MSKAATIHATCVVLGESGLLIRGASGAGKSSLALALLAAAHQAGQFARLVADDRVRMDVQGGRLLARTEPRLAGLVEERGTGILAVPHESAVLVRCIIDLAADDDARDIPPRLPDAADLVARLAGVQLPRLALSSALAPGDAARRVLAFLREL